jgi:HPt (histidine-containing phosphotransfer) domain-containing protein
MSGLPLTFDLDALMTWVDGDAELLDELADAFVTQVSDWLDELKTAVAGGDAFTAYRVAHGVKGAVGNMGATAVRDAAAELEAMGRAGDLGAAPTTLDRLETGLLALSAFLGAAPWRQTARDARPT